jgi:hypothetical protein
VAIKHRSRQEEKPATSWVGFFLDLLLNSANGGDIFIRSVGLFQTTRLYDPKKPQYSQFRCENLKSNIRRDLSNYSFLQKKITT